MDDHTGKHSAKAMTADALRTTTNIHIGRVGNFFFLGSSFFFFLSSKNKKD
jgi:hypothetical protein